MSDLKLVAETAFRLHEEKLLSRDELVDILEECINATALDNGYADKYGLPCPTNRRKRIP
jgi:hypothetical protein